MKFIKRYADNELKNELNEALVSKRLTGERLMGVTRENENLHNLNRALNKRVAEAESRIRELENQLDIRKLKAQLGSENMTNDAFLRRGVQTAMDIITTNIQMLEVEDLVKAGEAIKAEIARRIDVLGGTGTNKPGVSMYNYISYNT